MAAKKTTAKTPAKPTSKQEATRKVTLRPSHTTRYPRWCPAVLTGTARDAYGGVLVRLDDGTGEFLLATSDVEKA